MDPGNGAILAEAEWPYRHGILSALPDGTAVPEGYVLQDPSDFREALYEVVKALLGSSGAKGAAVAAIGLDSTASTVVPVTEDLTPLCSLAPFRNHPGAYAVMWKDHRAAAEAAMLTEALRRTDAAWLDRFGGSIGAEALVSKAAHIALDMPGIYGAAYAFMEMGDWLTSLLTGRPALSRTMTAAAVTCCTRLDTSRPMNSRRKAFGQKYHFVGLPMPSMFQPDSAARIPPRYTW